MARAVVIAVWIGMFVLSSRKISIVTYVVFGVHGGPEILESIHSIVGGIGLESPK